MKTETITVAVEFKIKYDEKRDGSRKALVEQCTQEVPIGLWGCSTHYGSYAAERVGTRLLEHP